MLLLNFFSWILAVAPLALSVPIGFHDELVVEIETPVDIEFLTYNDGSYKMMVVRREGFIYMVDDMENPELNLILDISDRVCDDGSRGLLSALVHPNFEENHWVYLFYTRITDGLCGLDLETGPVNRVARYEMSPLNGTIDLSTEHILLETSRTVHHLHNGGDMKFGKDGYLYISTGDGGHQPVSADWSDLMGSIIRVTEDGRIPPRGNAFTKKAGYDTARCKFMGRPLPKRKGALCAEIWAKGLRNPFRFAMDPNANETRFFISDVGGGKWEEISEGGTNFRGVDYGWPVREGPCSRYGGKSGCELLSQYQDPVYWYRHSNTYKGGGAAVGGAFVPNGLWPKEYDGKFIFPDYVFDELYLLHEQTPCRVGCSEHIPAFSNTTFHGWGRITGAVFGPHGNTQALYYLTRTREAENGIRRISYTGSVQENRPPVALLTANATYVEVGDVVAFDASASFDPDGDTIRYQFTVNGVRLKWSRNPILLYEFQEKGRQNIRLRVRDDYRQRSLDHVKVFVGDLPKVEVSSPPEGAQFSVGEIFTLSANATTFAGEELPDSALSWEVRKLHNTHFHPFLSRIGNDITLPKAPVPEDLIASTNSYLEVILRVTDPDTELVREVRRNIMPRVVELQIDSIPSGLTLRIFDEEVVTPEIVHCWENQPLHVVAPENEGYLFESWSNGAEADQIIVVSSDGVL